MKISRIFKTIFLIDFLSGLMIALREVFKNKKMPGHMGDKLRTIQNIEIIKSDPENDLLYLKGSIPGSKNSEVLVKKAVKNIKKLTIPEKIEKIEKQKKTLDKKK